MFFSGARRVEKTAEPFQRKLSIAKRFRGPEGALNIKKRHVERMTRLPTKRLATACWEFIVVKRGWLQTAPLLDFASLQRANREIHQQVIHKCLWMSWGYFCRAVFVARFSKLRPVKGVILARGDQNTHPTHRCERPQTYRAVGNSVRHRAEQRCNTRATPIWWKDPAFRRACAERFSAPAAR